jgi:hypothetical protein
MPGRHRKQLKGSALEPSCTRFKEHANAVTADSRTAVDESDRPDS